MGGIKTPLTPFAGHDPLREVLILLRAADHDTLQGSLLLSRAAITISRSEIHQGTGASFKILTNR